MWCPPLIPLCLIVNFLSHARGCFQLSFDPLAGCNFLGPSFEFIFPKLPPFPINLPPLHLFHPTATAAARALLCFDQPDIQCYTYTRIPPLPPNTQYSSILLKLSLPHEGFSWSVRSFPERSTYDCRFVHLRAILYKSPAS